MYFLGSFSTADVKYKLNQITFPARKDKNIKLNIGQPINFRTNISGFNDGPHRQIRNAVAGVFVPPSISPEEVDEIPLHELAYRIRQSVLHLRAHPEDIQDQAILMAQIFQGGKPFVNFDPKLDFGMFTNWVCLFL